MKTIANRPGDYSYVIGSYREPTGCTASPRAGPGLASRPQAGYTSAHRAPAGIRAPGRVSTRNSESELTWISMGFEK